jgi:hypothetical protein
MFSQSFAELANQKIFYVSVVFSEKSGKKIFFYLPPLVLPFGGLSCFFAFFGGLACFVAFLEG